MGCELISVQISTRDELTWYDDYIAESIDRCLTACQELSARSTRDFRLAFAQLPPTGVAFSVQGAVHA